LAIGAFALGTAKSGEVRNVIEREGFPVRCVGEEPIYEVGVRKALVGAEGDVRTGERGVVLDNLQDQGLIGVHTDLTRGDLYLYCATHVQGIEIMQVDPTPPLVELHGGSSELVGK
jgi:hypothetical protein